MTPKTHYYVSGHVTTYSDKRIMGDRLESHLKSLHGVDNVNYMKRKELLKLHRSAHPESKDNG